MIDAGRLEYFTGDREGARKEETWLKARGFTLVEKSDKTLVPFEYTKCFQGSDPHSFGRNVHILLSWCEP